jgi:hypothetical protein
MGLTNNFVTRYFKREWMSPATKKRHLKNMKSLALFGVIVWFIVGDTEPLDTITKKMFKNVDKVVESLGHRCMQLQMTSMEGKLKQLMHQI